MNQLNYRTLVPAIVGAGVLVYESVTGHQVSSTLQSQMISEGVTIVATVLAIWGIFQNHKKG